MTLSEMIEVNSNDFRWSRPVLVTWRTVGGLRNSVARRWSRCKVTASVGVFVIHENSFDFVQQVLVEMKTFRSLVADMRLVVVCAVRQRRSMRRRLVRVARCDLWQSIRLTQSRRLSDSACDEGREKNLRNGDKVT